MSKKRIGIIGLVFVLVLSLVAVKARASETEFLRDTFSSNSGWIITNSDSANNSAVFGSTDPVFQELNISGVQTGLKLICNSTTSSVLMKRNISASSGSVRVFFYDDMATTKGAQFGIFQSGHTKGITVGVRSALYPDEYFYSLYNDGATTRLSSHVLRTRGWHSFELRAGPLGAYGVIDGINLTYLPADNGVVPWNVNFTNSFDELEIACPWKGQGSTQYFALLTGESWDEMPADINQRIKAIIIRYLTTANIPETASSTDYASIPTQIQDNRQRIAAGRAMAYAYLYKQEPTNSTYKTEALRALAYAVPATCTLNPVPTPRPNPPEVGSTGIVNAYMAVAGWIMWPDLVNDVNLKDRLKCTLYNEANNLWVLKPANRFIGRSGADRNAFTSMFMGVMSQMFQKPDYTATVESDHWLASAFCMAYHSKTTSDLEPDTYKTAPADYPNRYAPGCGVKTKNLYDGNETDIPGAIFKYRLDNHSYGPSGTYTLAGDIGCLGLGAAVFLRLRSGNDYNQSVIPRVFRWNNNVTDVYNAFRLNGNPDLNTGRYLGNIAILTGSLRDERQCEWVDNAEVTGIPDKGAYKSWCRSFNEIALSGRDESWNGSERNYDAYAYAGLLLGDGFADLKSATEFTWYMKPDYLVFPNKSSGLWVRFRDQVMPSSPPYVQGPIMFYSWRTVMNEAALEQLVTAAIITDQSFYFPAPVGPSPFLPGDLNQDGKVDIFDYNILVSDFGKTGTPGWIPADIIKNGKVDIFDYNVLVGEFGSPR